MLAILLLGVGLGVALSIYFIDKHVTQIKKDLTEIKQLLKNNK